LPCNKKNKTDGKRPASWGRFLIGVTVFIGVIFCFTRGVSPPGPLGEVVRHNQAHAIDATPYFYSEVEDMVELQAELDQWWNNPDTTVREKPAKEGDV